MRQRQFEDRSRFSRLLHKPVGQPPRGTRSGTSLSIWVTAGMSPSSYMRRPTRRRSTGSTPEKGATKAPHANRRGASLPSHIITLSQSELLSADIASTIALPVLSRQAHSRISMSAYCCNFDSSASLQQSRSGGEPSSIKSSPYA